MDYVWKISGEQGEGIDSTGHIFAFNVFKNGFEVATYRKYSSRIKGGNTTFEVRFSNKPVFARRKTLDVLIAFDNEALKFSKEQITPQTFVIVDTESNIQDLDQTECIKLYIPLSRIAKELTGTTISKNMVALGASIALFENMEYSYVMKQIERRFSKKSQEVVEKNKRCFHEGYQLAKNFLDSNSLTALKLEKKSSIDGVKRMLMSGNEALCLGALAAGCKYFAGYPITPASSILEFMVKNIGNFGGVAVQTEDEISAINSCIGASLAGVRAMAATSGPGFSLMAEAIGYAYMIETPIVIANIQRGGPSTGLPTKTENGDILMSAFVGHGDTEKIVISPTDPFEMFMYTFEAFNLAEKYQLPVIILSDLQLGENMYTTFRISDTMVDYLRIDRGKYINSEVETKVYRYQLTEDGISYRIVPSVRGLQFQTSGNEHNEKGFITENPEIRKSMVEKRMRKLSNFQQYFFGFEDIGYNPRTCIVTYGINYHFVREVCMELFEKEKYSFRIIKPVVFYPFPIEQIEKLVSNMDNLIFIEQNYHGQLRRLYYMFGGKKNSILINKYDGEPFFFEELYDKIKESVTKYSKV